MKTDLGKQYEENKIRNDSGDANTMIRGEKEKQTNKPKAFFPNPNVRITL